MKVKYDTRMVDDAVQACLVYHAVFLGPQVTEEELRARTRDRNALSVRAAVMWYLRTKGGQSLKEIGHRLDRDHTSVMSLLRRVHDLHTVEQLDALSEYVDALVERRAGVRAEELQEQVHRQMGETA